MTCLILGGSYSPYGHGFEAVNTQPIQTLPHSQKTGQSSSSADIVKGREKRNKLPSGAPGLAGSKCLVLFSVNLHRCVAGWITHWPFHLRDHNLNPTESHQRINGHRHSYFKAIKHCKKEKGVREEQCSAVVLATESTQLSWLSPYELEPWFGIEKLPVLPLWISKSGTSPWLLQDRIPSHVNMWKSNPCWWWNDGWLNGTYSAWTLILAGMTAHRDK